MIAPSVVRPAVVFLALAAVFALRGDGPVPAAGKTPNDWFLRQRAWPRPDIRQASRLAAWDQAAALRSRAERSAAAWNPVGPRNVGGRIADVACHPIDPDVVYVGAAEGGVFKTTDDGASWFPTFDDESSLSIGSVAIDPNVAEAHGMPLHRLAL